MILGQFLKPSLVKVVIVLILALLIFIVGIVFFQNPVWLRTSCAPSLSDPYLEMCSSWGFPGIINPYSGPLLALLYVLSSGISSMAQKGNKYNELKVVAFAITVVGIFAIAGTFYYGSWQGKCRAFAPDSLPVNTFQHKVEVKCPQLFNPFTWSEFQEEWESKN